MLEPLPANPIVGIYALTYNHEDFIAEAIESVLAQGWPAERLNFVLLDDGSADATPERVKPYEQHLTYVRQENQGINAAVNRLLGMVEGDVLVPLSGDDMLPPDRLERVVAHFQEHPETGMAYGDMEAIDERGRVFIPSTAATASESPVSGQIAGRLLKSNIVTAGSMAVRGALKRVMLPIPAATAWEDWWFAWAATNVAPVDYLDAIVYRYRRHRGNFMFGATRDLEVGLDRHAAEIPFRRYLLGNVRPGTCTPRHLFEAADALRAILGHLTENGRELEAVLPVTDAQRAAAERLGADAAALAGSAPVLAGFAAARAMAADPLDDESHLLLYTLAGSPNRTPPSIGDVRAVTVFAEAEELVSDPALLRVYADAVGDADDVTLVAVAREWDGGRLGAKLGPVVEHALGDDPPDILALPASTAAWHTALTQADGVLGLREWPIPGMPRFSEPGPLREYVELRRRLPLRQA
jgi:glycosyltransferase involved in cell wall biosynthesis